MPRKPKHATRAAIERAAAAAGGSIDWMPGDTVIYADLEPGHGRRWTASDCHVIAAAYDDGVEGPARDFLLDEILQGTDPCHCEECAETTAPIHSSAAA